MIDNAFVKILILDDNPEFSDLLNFYLQNLGYKKISVAASFSKAKSLVDASKPDIALLDIELGEEQSGIDFGLYLRKIAPEVRIVYFTNLFNEEVYESVKAVQPNAFLDKSLDELKIRQTIELALLQGEQSPATLQTTGHPLCYFSQDYIFVKVGPIFRKVELKEIDFIFLADRYANLQVGGSTYAVNLSMKQIGKALPDSIFIQIHQTYIINLYKINEVNFSDNQVQVSGKWLPLGVTYRKAFQEKLVLLY